MLPSLHQFSILRQHLVRAQSQRDREISYLGRLRVSSRGMPLKVYSSTNLIGACGSPAGAVALPVLSPERDTTAVHARVAVHITPLDGSTLAEFDATCAGPAHCSALTQSLRILLGMFTLTRTSLRVLSHEHAGSQIDVTWLSAASYRS